MLTLGKMPIAKGRPQQRTSETAARSMAPLILTDEVMALSIAFILDRERMTKAGMDVQTRDSVTLDMAVS